MYGIKWFIENDNEIKSKCPENTVQNNLPVTTVKIKKPTKSFFKKLIKSIFEDLCTKDSKDSERCEDLRR